LSQPQNQVQWSNWSNIDIPMIPIAGVNHNQIWQSLRRGWSILC